MAGLDIRLDAGFPDHFKTEKLIQVAGGEWAVRSLLRLWAWAAKHRPKGVLTGMSDEDLAIVCRVQCDPQCWKHALSTAGWLDETEDALTIHDWEDHQPFVFHSDKRSKRAKKAASVRWKKRYGRKRRASAEHATSNAGSNAGSNAPTPSPAPIAEKGRAHAPPASEERADASRNDTEERLDVANAIQRVRDAGLAETHVHQFVRPLPPHRMTELAHELEQAIETGDLEHPDMPKWVAGWFQRKLAQERRG